MEEENIRGVVPKRKKRLRAVYLAVASMGV
jgi:hypothetical protein